MVSGDEKTKAASEGMKAASEALRAATEAIKVAMALGEDRLAFRTGAAEGEAARALAARAEEQLRLSKEYAERAERYREQDGACEVELHELKAGLLRIR
jgi:hypothetical protein